MEQNINRELYYFLHIYLRGRSKRVRTPVGLLRSLSDYYHSERFEPTYTPAMG